MPGSPPAAQREDGAGGGEHAEARRLGNGRVYCHAQPPVGEREPPSMGF